MAERVRYLLAYDIREARRLRRVHQVAKDYGYPLQYSLFICDLTKIELIALKSNLMAEANLREDSIAIFDLGRAGPRVVERVEFLGVGRPVGEPGEATIW